MSSQPHLHNRGASHDQRQFYLALQNVRTTVPRVNLSLINEQTGNAGRSGDCDCQDQHARPSQLQLATQLNRCRWLAAVLADVQLTAEYGNEVEADLADEVGRGSRDGRRASRRAYVP